jgi:hypothetical protein
MEAEEEDYRLGFLPMKRRKWVLGYRVFTNEGGRRGI